MVALIGDKDPEYRSRGQLCLSVLLTVVSVLYVSVCLLFSLLARLYIKTYYTAAHLAALSVIIGSFFLFHRCECVRHALGLTHNAFRGFRTVLDFLYLLGCLCPAVCYSALFSMSITLNYDFMGALIWGWVDSVLMFYMLVFACRDNRNDYTTQPAYAGTMFSIDSDPTTHADSRYIGFDSEPWEGIPAPSQAQLQDAGCCCIFCTGIWRCLLWISYLIFHLILLILFGLSAYQSAASLRDVVLYRPDSELHIVEVGHHQPLALHVLCNGTGPETILFEQNLAGNLYLTLDYLPRELMANHKVCVYDRRGHGWSATYESDYPGIWLKEPQSSRNSIEFLRALIDLDTVNISTPFYLAGHRYGGQHLAYMALTYPEYIKGLIYIDTSDAVPRTIGNEDLNIPFELVVNAQPTGILRFLVDVGVLDFDSGHLADNSENKDRYLASLLSNTGLVSEWREWDALQGQPQWDSVFSGTDTQYIYKRVLVVEPGTNNRTFPDVNFLLFNDTFYHTIDGADSTTLVSDVQYVREVAQWINNFISGA